MSDSRNAKRNFEEMRRRRLRAAELFEQGEKQAAVARALKVSRQSVMRWFRDWKSAGKPGLQGAGRAGRKPRLNDGQRRALERELLRGPLAHGFRTELWTLPRIAQVIKQITGVAYHAGHVWRVLRQLGWSLQKPTTRARERDEAAIARWVRETWPAVKKTPGAAGPSSSSSTKAASPSGRRSDAAGRRGDKLRS